MLGRGGPPPGSSMASPSGSVVAMDSTRPDWVAQLRVSTFTRSMLSGSSHRTHPSPLWTIAARMASSPTEIGVLSSSSSTRAADGEPRRRVRASGVAAGPPASSASAAAPGSAGAGSAPGSRKKTATSAMTTSRITAAAIRARRSMGGIVPRAVSGRARGCGPNAAATLEASSEAGFWPARPLLYPPIGAPLRVAVGCRCWCCSLCCRLRWACPLVSEEVPYAGIALEQYRTSSPAADVWVARVDLCAAGIRVDATKAPTGCGRCRPRVGTSAHSWR